MRLYIAKRIHQYVLLACSRLFAVSMCARTYTFMNENLKGYNLRAFDFLILRPENFFYALIP